MLKAFLIGAVTLAVITLAIAQTAVPTETVRIAAGGRAQVNFIPLTLADRLGYFKAEGLNVEVFDYQAGSRSVEALVAGNVDLVTGAYEHTLLMQHRGVHIQALVLLARTYGLVIALSKEQAAKYRSPQDLKGLRIGVSAPGSTTALVLEVFLRKAGMTLDDVSVIAVGQSAAAVAAMKYGKIDGIVNPDPVITKLVNDGDAVAILDSRTEQGARDLHGGYLASSADSHHAGIRGAPARGRPGLHERNGPNTGRGSGPHRSRTSWLTCRPNISPATESSIGKR